MTSAKLLKPVLNKLSQHTIKDSFSCAQLIQETTILESGHMCSFDIKNLFTSVPLDETIQLCVQHLYHSDDITPPTISEKNFTKLVKKVTVGVEFSFNGVMYQQVDGVAMGSPLGPVLANIFVGHQEQKIPQLSGQLLYKRYVDDSLSISTAEEENERFLKVLNSLHPALQYTCENENDGKLPFLDILVKKAEAQKVWLSL